MLKCLDYVTIVENLEKIVMVKAANEFIGAKGFIEKLTTDNGSTYALVRFDNHSVENRNKNFGGIYFPECMLSLNVESKEQKRRYLKELEEEYDKYKHHVEYRWGKCEKCGGGLDMHYTLWCPHCTTPKELIYNDDCVDIIKLLSWCETRRYGIKDRIWREYIQNVIRDIRNDTVRKRSIEKTFSLDHMYMKNLPKGIYDNNDFHLNGRGLERYKPIIEDYPNEGIKDLKELLSEDILFIREHFNGLGINRMEFTW